MTESVEPAATPAAAAPPLPRRVVFRLPRSAYLTVLFLLFCAAPVALAEDSGDMSVHTVLTWRLVFLLVPLLAIVFIARTATIATADGLRVRAAFGSRQLTWAQLRGLSLSGRAVYAVVDGGAIRLPCVGIADLSLISRMSDGRLPPVREAVRRYAPSRRPARRRVRR